MVDSPARRTRSGTLVLRRMTTAGPYGYGYGLFISRQSGKTDIEHSGRVFGFASKTEYFPEAGIGIIVLSNKLERSRSSSLARPATPSAIARDRTRQRFRKDLAPATGSTQKNLRVCK